MWVPRRDADGGRETTVSFGVALHLSDDYLQTHDSVYSILTKARSQLSSIPMACHLN